LTKAHRSAFQTATSLSSKPFELIVENPNAPESLRSRLIKAALDCFPLTTITRSPPDTLRNVPAANVSMIRYYWQQGGAVRRDDPGDPEPLLDVPMARWLASTAGFAEFLGLYYRTMSERRSFQS
jgi:hypothetical protein